MIDDSYLVRAKEAHAVGWLEAFNLSRVVHDPCREILSLSTNPVGLCPEALSYTNPEVINIYFESYTHGANEFALDQFVKGALVIGNLVTEESRQVLRAALQVVTEHAKVVSSLPAMDELVYDDYHVCLKKIVENGEPISWLSLCGFSAGLWWAAGLLSGITKKFPRSWKQKGTVRQYLKGYMLKHAELGYLPS